MVSAVPADQKKTVLDVWNGYHWVPLTKESRKYFGFLTEWGTFHYKVAPQGFLGSSDHYVGVYNNILNKVYDEESKLEVLY